MLPADIRYQYLYSEYEEKKIINKFIEHLEIGVKEKFGIKGTGKLTGSKKQGKYMIYFRPAVDNKSGKSIELTMELCSLRLYELIEDKEMNMDISDKDLDILCYNRAKLVKATIYGLYTYPTGIGLGGFIVKEVIGFLRKIDSIKVITLMPDGPKAKSFWSYMGFNELNKEIYDKYYDSIDFDMSHNMIYEIS